MRPHRAPLAASGLLVALALTACMSEGTAMPSSDPRETSSSAPSSRPPFQTSTPGPLGPTGAPADVPEARWAAIGADLAARDVSGEPELISAERVEFSDGSLGCPQPGQSYTQSVVQGLRVLVRADGKTYDYRFGRGDRPRLCER